jgi:GT2 family glycosyltransferase
MISVIIPTCNRNDLLGKCLDALKPEIQIMGYNYEVIVTDDSNDHISKKFIETNYAWVKWVRGAKKGPASNRNNGAKYAKAEWLVFIDDDCMPANNLLKEYCSAIKNNPECLAFEGAIYPDSWALLKKDMAECPVNTEGGCFWSANICVNKNLFKQVGGFDEAFLIAAQEDQDLYLRILQKTNVCFLKSCVVIHPVRHRNLNEKIRKIPIELNNWILFSRKTKTWLQIFTDGLLSQVKAFFRTLKELKIRSLLYHLITLLYLIPGIIIYAFQNRRRQNI